MFKLRDYQEEACNNTVKALEEYTHPIVTILPTAGGKSLLIAEIIKRLKEYTLVLQPSKELLEQNYNKYTMYGNKASIFSASMDSKEVGDVTYATIKSIKNLPHLFKHKRLVIIDECHLGVSSGSELTTFLKKLGPKIKILGVTATAFRLVNFGTMEDSYSVLRMLTETGKGVGFFKKIVHVTQIKEIIDKKYWADIIYKEESFSDNGLYINSSGADYTSKSLQNYFEKNDFETKILEEIEKVPDRKSILIAVPSIVQALSLQELIPNSIAVHSKMSARERKLAVDSFKNLDTRVAINVDTLSTGFDHPMLDAAILARPTLSLAFFYQFLGRLTRTHENKKNGLFIDLSGSKSKFGNIKDLVYKNVNGNWNLYNDNNNEKLTGVRLDGVVVMPAGQVRFLNGSFKGILVQNTPKKYRDAILDNTDIPWSNKTIYIKKELIRLKMLGI